MQEDALSSTCRALPAQPTFSLQRSPSLIQEAAVLLFLMLSSGLRSCLLLRYLWSFFKNLKYLICCLHDVTNRSRVLIYFFMEKGMT